MDLVRIPLSTAPPLVNDGEHTKLYAGYGCLFKSNHTGTVKISLYEVRISRIQKRDFLSFSLLGIFYGYSKSTFYQWLKIYAQSTSNTDVLTSTSLKI